MPKCLGASMWKIDTLRRIGVAWLVLGLLVATVGTAQGETASATAERRIKAAFLSKFADYVEWPTTAFAQTDAPFRIAVMGDDAMAEELKVILADRRLDGRAFEVRTLSENQTAQDVHILFVAALKRSALQTAAMPGDLPVLVVTDFEAGRGQAATINFFVKDARVRFNVSIVDAERRHLKLGSGLLSVAQNVRRSGE